MNQPIEERNLFMYAILVPAIQLVVGILLYVIVLSNVMQIISNPLGYAAGQALSGLGVDNGYSSGSGTGTVVFAILLVMVAIAAIIYFIYLWTGVVRDINIICDGDMQKFPLMSFVWPYLICLLPGGVVFFIFYLYRIQDYMARNSHRYGIRLRWSPDMVLFFAIFFNVVAFAFIIISFNEMARAYNAGGGYAPSTGNGYSSGFDSNEIVNQGRNVMNGGNSQGTLLCTAGESAGSNIIMSEGESVTLGRDPQISDVILRNDKKISRRHCTITYRNGQFYVTDYSSNGTKLGNGQKLESGRETLVGTQGVIRLSDQSEFRVQAN